MPTDGDTVKAVSAPQVVRESRRDEFSDSTRSRGAGRPTREADALTYVGFGIILSGDSKGFPPACAASAGGQAARLDGR
jgi:hypothetical protein